jgi:hypothetical protein
VVPRHLSYSADPALSFSGLVGIFIVHMPRYIKYQLCYTEFMSALFPDTHPKMEALQIQLWRQANPTRKMHMLAQLNASARLLAMTGLRSRYPQESEAKLRRRLADLLLGEELARKVYGEHQDAK